MTTYFQDFCRDDGKPVTVEYGVESYGEPNFDYPGHICDGGGSGHVMQIIDCWPNDAAFEDLARRRNDRSWKKDPSLVDRVAEWLLELRMTIAKLRRGTLSSEERERMEAWLDEHHVFEDEEPE